MDPESLVFLDRMAEGAYGVVWRARLRRRRRQETTHQERGRACKGKGSKRDIRFIEKEEEVAVKVQRVPSDEQEQANLLIELSILHGLIHPRLVRYFGAALLSEADILTRDKWRPLLRGPRGSKWDHCGVEQVNPAKMREEEDEEEEAKEGEEGEEDVKEQMHTWVESEAIQKEEMDATTSSLATTPASPSADIASLVLIAMELCGHGSLRDALSPSLPHQSPLPLSWPLRVRIVSDVAEGLTFLHAHGLLHRDLKTSNILLTHPLFRAKICDHAFVSSSHSPDLLSITCGTFEFQAPEQLLNGPESKITGKADMFSFGVVMSELVTGKIPGSGQGQESFLQRRPKELFEVRGEEVENHVLPGCPPSLLALALQCLAQDAEDRPTALEAWEWARELWAEVEREEGGERKKGGGRKEGGGEGKGGREGDGVDSFDAGGSNSSPGGGVEGEGGGGGGGGGGVLAEENSGGQEKGTEEVDAGGGEVESEKIVAASSLSPSSSPGMDKGSGGKGEEEIADARRAARRRKKRWKALKRKQKKEKRSMYPPSPQISSPHLPGNRDEKQPTGGGVEKPDPTLARVDRTRADVAAGEPRRKGWATDSKCAPCPGSPPSSLPCPSTTQATCPPNSPDLSLLPSTAPSSLPPTSSGPCPGGFPPPPSPISSLEATLDPDGRRARAWHAQWRVVDQKMQAGLRLLLKETEERGRTKGPARESVEESLLPLIADMERSLTALRKVVD